MTDLSYLKPSIRYGEEVLSYQVIAIKWRPQTFQELIGQEHVTQTLTNAIENHRIPHATLFTGSRGVGKTSAARILAKSLKCSPQPCNKCSICKEISNGSHVDVMEIDGASHNGVDAIRGIIDKACYLPLQGQYKICIIDEVHMLSTSAFNALLKTLEEPPSHMKFIFATTEIQKIPRTILSRCQQFHFRQIPTRIISEHLQKICKEEKVQIDKEALWSIARHGEGSMRDSQSLLDQTITFTGRDKHITLEQVIELLGLTDRRVILDTITALCERSPSQILDILQELHASSYDLKSFVNDLIEEIKNLLFIKECQPDDINSFVDLPDTEITKLKELAQKVRKEDIHILFDMAFKGSLDILKAQDGRTVLEMLFLRMVHAPKYINILDLGKTVLNKSSQTIKPHIETSPTEKKQSITIPDKLTKNTKIERQTIDQKQIYSNQDYKDKETGLSSQKKYMLSTEKFSEKEKKETLISQQFSDFIAQIKQNSPLLGAKLEKISLEKVDGHTIFLSLPADRSFLLSQLKSQQNLKEIQREALDFWQKDLTFQFQVTQKSKQDFRFTTENTNQQNNLINEIEDVPVVQEIKSTLDAKIQNVSHSRNN